MMSTNVSRELGDLLDQCDTVIGNLNYAWGKEVDGGNTSFTSYWANERAALGVNDLAIQAARVNELIQQNRSLYENGQIALFDTNFSGDQIMEAENREWSTACMLIPTYGRYQSYNTASTLTETSAKVRKIEDQALAIYNYLNPQAPRKKPYCRECWSCFNPLMRVTIEVIKVLATSKKRN